MLFLVLGREPKLGKENTLCQVDTKPLRKPLALHGGEWQLGAKRNYK